MSQRMPPVQYIWGGCGVCVWNVWGLNRQQHQTADALPRWAELGAGSPGADSRGAQPGERGGPGARRSPHHDGRVLGHVLKVVRHAVLVVADGRLAELLLPRPL
jgi:hypothetical protein